MFNCLSTAGKQVIKNTKNFSSVLAVASQSVAVSWCVNRGLFRSLTSFDRFHTSEAYWL